MKRLLAGLLLCAGLLPGATHVRRRAVKHPMRKEYVHQTWTKGPLLRSAAIGGYHHLRNDPKQLGRGSAALGRRVGSSLGTHLVKNTIEYGVAGVRHEDLHYHKSTDPRFSRRLRHALVSTVVTRKTTTGKKTAAGGKIAGSMGAGMISRTWQPAVLHTASSGVATGGILLGGEAAANVAREFIPARHHVRRRARRR